MKLKLKQRIAIKFYQTKIKAISLVSTQKAAQSLFNLFCTPYSGKPKRKAPLVFKKAISISILYNKQLVNGWHFNSKYNNGKKILIVHGFDSCAYKSETIIEKFVSLNYEVLAFDALGHGTSDGKYLNAKIYSEIINLINKAFGNIYAFITHSLGGLATTLAIEKFNINVQKLVLIAPATETTRAINNFFSFLKMPEFLKPEIEKLIIEIGEQPSSYFSIARAIQNINVNTFWIHDYNDFICPIEDVLPVEKMKLPHIKFLFTKKLGHNFIYRNKDVLNEVNAFLNE